jgi:hypothetical protein
MEAKVAGLAALEAKIARIPGSIRDAAKDANDQNALDFMRQVHAIIPRDDKAGEHLADTLVKEAGKTSTAVRVAIGGPEAPYPAHLEFGHRGPDGKHVPAKPFWFTTLRVMRRRFRDRASRAASKAIKAFQAEGSSDGQP